MKKMLMVATVPSMIGQFNMNNIQLLQEMGYEVHVACDFSDRSVWTEERVAEFERILEEKEIQRYQIDFSRSVLKIRRHIASYRQLKQIVKKNNYNFVHCHTPIAGAISRFVCKSTKIKCIYTAHGFHFYKGAPLKNWLFFYPIEWICSWMTDVLITINKEDYKRAKDYLKAKNTEYIPGVGFDTKKFRECIIDKNRIRQSVGLYDDDFVMLSVGELSRRKNQRVVIEALYKMKKEGIIDREIYVIVGEGELGEEFRRLIVQYELTGHVKLLGFRQDIAELCKMADCFIHPSVREGLGIAPLEAMASGLPLISAYINGIKDYTENNVSGVCIDNPNSINDMMNAIIKMKSEQGFREKCAENNVKISLKYDIENTNRIMKNIYKK